MRILVVHGHPVGESFGSALRDTAVAALRASGHDVDLLDLYAIGFDPVLSREAHSHHLDGPQTKPEIGDLARRLLAAQALVFVYPTWWGGPPAIVKGWIDRVWVADVAFGLPPGRNLIVPRLRNIRRLCVVTTYGSSRFVNALEGEPGKRMILWGLRSLMHPLCRRKWLPFYQIDRSTESQRAAFLARVDRSLRWK